MAKQAFRWPIYFLASLLLSIPAFAQSDLYVRALELFQQHQWNDAAAAFQQYEKNQAGKSDAPLYAAKAFINLGQIPEAAKILEPYATNHPASEDAVYLLAYLRFRQDKPRESLKLYTAAAKLKTPDADDLKIVSLDYVLLSDYDDAAKYLEESLKMDPNNLEARYHLGRVRYQQNKFDQAIAAFQEVARRDPANVKAEENLGLSLEGKNENAQATAAYRKAIELDEAATVHDEQPYLDLGILLGKLNRTAEAIPLLTKAGQIQPKSPKVRYELGKACLAQNQLEEAQKQVEEAVKLDDANSANHYLLGRIYQKQGKKDLAAQQFTMTNNLIGKKNSTESGMSTGPR
ncbi:MAG TPA: tetratricopeptide repeat protein [Terriglobales bacterium]|jgi:tetratricopeptide (TPR) repeat protein